MIDPIVKKIREVRELDAAKHEFDLYRIASVIRQHETVLAEQGWKLRKMVVNKFSRRPMSVGDAVSVSQTEPELRTL